jgi:hypothetical protein
MSSVLDLGSGSIWGPVVVSLLILIGVLIAWLIATWSRSRTAQEPTDEKLTTYACGEEVKTRGTIASDIEIAETRPHSEMYFSPILAVFRGFFDHVRRGHSGDLNTYLLWAVSGIAVFLVMIWVLFS